MRDMYGLDRNDLNTDRKDFLRQLVNDDQYYDILKKDDKSSTRIMIKITNKTILIKEWFCKKGGL